MHDLLSDACIRARLTDRPGETALLSLPAIYAALMRDEITAFPALRPHQSHAWHMLLAQLGAVALHAAGGTAPPEDEEEWRSLLRGLTGDFPDDEPWRLVVPDPSRPAFLQPPAPEGLAAYRSRIETADELDPLVTSKNHDLKAARMRDAEPDDWLFALVGRQTMDGFMGAGNYGISRMNGGFASRVFLGFAPPGGMGAHLRRDIAMLLDSRQRIVDDPKFPAYRAAGGIALLWTLPWDGATSLALTDLDPLYIEVCRRIRLYEDGGRIAAHAAGSKVARIDAKNINGLTGDPWAPIVLDKSGGKALSLTHHGFAYYRLADLLFDAGKSVLPPAALYRPGEDTEQEWRLVARGLARGQGKTEGFHERFLPMSRAARRGLGIPAARHALGELSNRQIADIRLMGVGLRTAIAIVASGGKAPAEVSQDDRSRADPFSRALDQAADAHFFPALWERFDAREADDEAAGQAVRQGFIRALFREASRLLDRASDTVPCPAIRRHAARARAHRYFRSRLLSEFPFLAEREAGTSPEAEPPDDEHVAA